MPTTMSTLTRPMTIKNVPTCETDDLAGGLHGGELGTIDLKSRPRVSR